MRRKEGKLKKGRWKIENASRKSSKKSKRVEDLFFFFFFAFHFWKRQKFVWVYQNGNFLPGNSISRWKKSGKMTLPPQKNMPVTPLSEHYMKAMVWVPSVLYYFFFFQNGNFRWFWIRWHILKRLYLFSVKNYYNISSFYKCFTMICMYIKWCFTYHAYQ